MTLLSAKGTFRKPTRENVSVDVENGLTGVFTGVEDQTVVAVGVLGGELVRRGDDLSKESRIAHGKFGDVGVFLGFGNDEKMNGSLRRNVPKRDDAIGFEHDVGRNLAVDDFAEDAHGFQSIRVTTGRAGRSEPQSRQDRPSTFA